MQEGAWAGAPLIYHHRSPYDIFKFDKFDDG